MNGHRSSRQARWLGLIAASTVLVAACSTSGSSESAEPSLAADAACVNDVPGVIAAPEPADPNAELSADLVATLDAAAQAGLKEAATDGAIVGVRTPEGTWAAAYGVADPDTGAPMTTDMHQRIGSVTKTMTGTLLLQLVQEGTVSLDDTIGEYVEGVPNGDTVTLRQLADMTSGVASYTMSEKFTDVYFASPEKVFTPDELLSVGLSLPALFEPGAEFNYSNTNTVLLGKVIEQVTGRDVADLMVERIYTPLGLSGTSWPGDSPDLPEPYARGFTTQGQGTSENPADATHWNPAWGWTAGEAISTLSDLLVYARAIGTGQGLLDPATQEIRLTSFPGPAGYGIAMGCTDGWVGHTGELPGYNTSVFYDTRTDTSIVVETNSDIASGDCTVSVTLPDNDTSLPCMSPASRIALAVSTALGHPLVTPPIT